MTSPVSTAQHDLPFSGWRVFDMVKEFRTSHSISVGPELGSPFLACSVPSSRVLIALAMMQEPC